MRKVFIFFLLLFLFVSGSNGAWWFEEINYSPAGSPYEDDSIESIDWRPQGDYAVIASSEVLLRYEYPAGPLTYAIYPDMNLDRIKWAPDGSYALITGGTHIYRYEHSETGFGSVTELTSIEKNDPSDTVTFYDVVWNPAAPQSPPYITTNYESGTHQIRVYRYEPGHSPDELWIDYSGGTTYASQWDYIPISAAFQADGDYFVIADKSDTGIYVYDPDGSTFPKEVSGSMQFYYSPGNVGNACAVTMSPVSGKRFVLLKGSGEVQRLTQTGLPPTFEWDEPGGPNMTNYRGDADYSGTGLKAVVVEREMWSPYHRIGTFDNDGNFTGGIDTVTLSEQRSLRIDAVDWHPYAGMGLMAGEDRWIIRFQTDEIPTVTPTQGPTDTPVPIPTFTPTPFPTPSVPAMKTYSILLLMLLMGTILIRAKRFS